MTSAPILPLLGSLIAGFGDGAGNAADPNTGYDAQSIAAYHVNGSDDRRAVETRVIDLTDTIRGKRVRRAELPALRNSLHAAAQAECERLRRKVGSCLIRWVDISEREDALNPGEFYVRAKVQLMWLIRSTDDTVPPHAT